MKRLFSYLFICFMYVTGCYAQSASLKSKFDQVNQTLKSYVIGTREYMPYYMKSEGDRWVYKKKSLTYEYPNLILEYVIGSKVKYPGYHSDIKEGNYKIIIPLSSIIEYPGSYSLVGQKQYNNTTINILNEEGLTKYTKGNASLLKSFSIYGDEELTAKKFATELKALQQLIISENFQGKLGIVQQKSPSSTSKGTRNGNMTPTTSTPTRKVGKYVQ